MLQSLYGIIKWITDQGIQGNSFLFCIQSQAAVCLYYPENNLLWPWEDFRGNFIPKGPAERGLGWETVWFHPKVSSEGLLWDENPAKIVPTPSWNNPLGRKMPDFHPGVSPMRPGIGNNDKGWPQSHRLFSHPLSNYWKTFLYSPAM